MRRERGRAGRGGILDPGPNRAMTLGLPGSPDPGPIANPAPGSEPGPDPGPIANPDSHPTVTPVLILPFYPHNWSCSYQRFVNCYRCFYKLQPQLTRSIYDQFISQLQASIKVNGGLSRVPGGLWRGLVQSKEDSNPCEKVMNMLMLRAANVLPKWQKQKVEAALQSSVFPRKAVGSFRLENTTRTVKSKHFPSTAKATTKPCP